MEEELWLWMEVERTRSEEVPSSSWCTKPVWPVVFHLQRFMGLLFSSGRLFIDNPLQLLKLLHKKSTAKFWQSMGKFSSKVCNKINVLFYNKPLNYLMTSSVVLWMMDALQQRIQNIPLQDESPRGHLIQSNAYTRPATSSSHLSSANLNSFNRTRPLFTLHFL